MTILGIDQESHLHTLGGPLYEPATCEEALCEECEDEIDPGRYHCVAGEICCDVCALRLASKVLDAAADRLTSDERQALDVVRQISREVSAGVWEQLKPQTRRTR